MLRLKIQDFKLNIDEKTGLAASLPCSMYTVLAAAEGKAPWELHSDARSVEFTGVVEIEPHVLSHKHICLRIAGVSSPAEVVLNGKTISTPDSRDRIYVYNVKDRLFPGYNTIVIRFRREDEGRKTSGIRLRDLSPFDPAIESVTLMAFESAAINSVNITQAHAESGVTLNVNMGIIGDKTNVRAVATLVSPSGKIYYGGLSDGHGTITVSDPLLWWPCGMGVPNLYDLSVNLYHGDSAEDVFDMRIGLRSITADNGGDAVSVNVGGLPAFLRGMQVVPATLGAEFADPKKLARLIASAAGVGVNAIYVSPYGKAPSDELFDLCDKYGILVVLGIGDRHPTDTQQDDALKREIVDGPRRISHHASLAAFYINSSLTARADALADLLRSYCPDVPTVVAPNEPVTAMPVSLPDPRTLSEILTDGENNLLSYAAETATEPAGALPGTVFAMSADYKMPLGNRQLAYVSQLAYADRLSTELATARRLGRRSFFVNRLNDPRPLVSPATVDHYGRWTAAHYRLARLYSPFSILHETKGLSVSFVAYNDRAKEYSGTLSYRVLDTDNRELYRGSLECMGLAPTSSADLGTVDVSDYVMGHERERYLVYSYSDGVQTRSATVFFCPKKHFKFRDPAIRATVSGSGRRFDVTLYAESFAAGVVLGFSETDALFGENGFDIIDNAPVRVLFETTETVSAERLESELSLTSLYDVGRES